MSNTCVTYLWVGDNISKEMLIPHRVVWHKLCNERWPLFKAITQRWARGLLASWWGNGSPRRRWVAVLRGWPAILGLRYGPDSYGRQQIGIFVNGRKLEQAMPREWWSLSGCKALCCGTKNWQVNNLSAWLYHNRKPRLTTCQQPRWYVGGKRCSELLGVKGVQAAL